MKRVFSIVLLLLFSCGIALGATYEKVPPAKNKIKKPTAEWTSKIEKLSPEQPTVKPEAKRRALLFSLATGYYHQVIPHTDVVMKVLGKKSGAFEVVHSNDIEMFSPEKIKDFDTVILNNTCSLDPKRNIFLDVLSGKIRNKNYRKQFGNKYKDLTDEQRKARAKELEQSLLDYVASGGGVFCIHGGITMLNGSPKYGEMIGGSFDFHPRRQKVTLDLVEPDHPLLAAFSGKGFIHNDEPYFFKGAYAKENFRPLLRMDVDKLDKKTQALPRIKVKTSYAAWIKKYGKGRVFFVAPGHQPESFESAALLRFFLDGMQYTLGDLKCDDSVRKEGLGTGD